MGMESVMQEIVAEGKGKKARDEGEDEEKERTEEERQVLPVEGVNGPGGEELAGLVGAGGEAPGRLGVRVDFRIS